MKFVNLHDPIRHLRNLREALSQDKKPIGFFLSAGCPLAVEVPKNNWPLIPDVRNLTLWMNKELSSKDKKKPNRYDRLIDELRMTNKNPENVEDILSFVRGLKDVAKGGTVRNFSENDLLELEKEICKKIVKKMDVELPNKNTPYHKLASWVTSIDRAKPVEIFTTNYDLLMEQALEDSSVPYFDGFVGSRQPFFDLRAVEEQKIPPHWTRLWKLHGSINWYTHPKSETVIRLNSVNHEGSNLIYPSYLKYSESRKMPYVALIDRLAKFIRENSSVLVVVGYSFTDDHLNDTIINSLRSNPTSIVIAMLHKKLANYTKALKLANEDRRPNLSLWAYDEAVIGTIRGKWRVSNKEDEGFFEENMAKVLETIVPLSSKDDRLTVEDTTTERSILKMGDYAELGDFLQSIIGTDKDQGENEE